MNEILSNIESDPFIIIDEDDFVSHSIANMNDPRYLFVLRTDQFFRLLEVIKYFAKYQIMSSWIRRWTIPALTRYIKKYIFNDNISRYQGQQLATILIECSRYGSVF